MKLRQTNRLENQLDRNGWDLPCHGGGTGSSQDGNKVARFKKKVDARRSGEQGYTKAEKKGGAGSGG